MEVSQSCFYFFSQFNMESESAQFCFPLQRVGFQYNLDSQIYGTMYGIMRLGDHKGAL